MGRVAIDTRGCGLHCYPARADFGQRIKFSRREKKERAMSVAKVIEITSSSKKSFEDAIRKGVKKTSETVKNIQGVWVKEQKCVVENGEITEFRVDMKLTFIVN
jgi:flavin-binding protein dodecin